MQPLKPEVVARILKDRPDVTKEHIREYQRLLAEHFNENPHVLKTTDQKAAHEGREQRLKELHRRMFE